ncbi:hypothetical protein [Actinocrispum sp. NPDC049592]|uniref:hypothetical protein n=1 Tax=Actinocrispum sp. NPDC049592 TaxID=3154835 RepID=UPI00342ADF08
MTAQAWPWTLLRVVSVVLAVDTFLEPVFAGRFLSGDFGMLAFHENNADFGVFVLALIQVIAAVIARRRLRAPRWLIPAAVVQAVLLTTQIMLGFVRVIGLHVPLGVALVATTGWFALWVCTHRPADRLVRDAA